MEKEGTTISFPPIIPATITKAYALLAESCKNILFKQVYSIMAGLYASWFFGNNPTEMPMYDIRHGYVYDGIISRYTINRNSGCEATAVTLDALTHVLFNNISIAYIYTKGMMAVSPIYLEFLKIGGSYEVRRSSLYSSNDAFILSEGDLIYVNLQDAEYISDINYKVVLLVKRSDALVSLKYNEKTLGNYSVITRDWSYVSLVTIPNITNGKLLIEVEKGTMVLDEILLVPIMEYKLFKVRESTYLL